MKIQVTSEHIKNGKPRSKTSCPLALAIKEKTHEFVFVGVRFVVVGRKFMDHNDQMYEFIRNFDSGIVVEPFEFELNYENKSNK